MSEIEGYQSSELISEEAYTKFIINFYNCYRIF
jgi:hypothetical protein